MKDFYHKSAHLLSFDCPFWDVARMREDQEPLAVHSVLSLVSGRTFNMVVRRIFVVRRTFVDFFIVPVEESVVICGFVEVTSVLVVVVVELLVPLLAVLLRSLVGTGRITRCTLTAAHRMGGAMLEVGHSRLTRLRRRRLSMIFAGSSSTDTSRDDVLRLGKLLDYELEQFLHADSDLGGLHLFHFFKFLSSNRSKGRWIEPVSCYHDVWRALRPSTRRRRDEGLAEGVALESWRNAVATMGVPVVVRMLGTDAFTTMSR